MQDLLFMNIGGIDIHNTLPHMGGSQKAPIGN